MWITGGQRSGQSAHNLPVVPNHVGGIWIDVDIRPVAHSLAPRMHTANAHPQQATDQQEGCFSTHHVRPDYGVFL